MAKRVVLLIAAVVAMTWIGFHSRDLPEVDEAGLEVPWRELGPGEDALPEIEAALRLHAWPDDEQTAAALDADEDWDVRLAREWVARNREALTRLERAVAIGHLQLSLDRFGDAEDLSAWGRLPRLLRLRAHTKLAAGDAAGAREDLLLALRYGHLLQGATGASLVPAMLGTLSHRIALWGVRDLAFRTQRSPAEARALAASLESFRPDPEAWARVWAAEYQHTRGVLDGFADELGDSPLPHEMRWLQPLLPDRYLYQHNRTVSALAEAYRALQGDSRRLCSELRTTKRLPLAASEKLRLWLEPNGVGNVLVLITTDDLQRFHMRRCAMDTLVSATQALVALHAHLRATGRLPHSLEALVPAYLDAVPRDGFDGRPLRYDPTREVVYSVGADLVDAGGADSDGPLDGDEPTFAISPWRSAGG